jgi:hypothetical protein
MLTVLLVLLGLDMLAVLVVMLWGVIGMVDVERSMEASNRLMRWRVGLQGVAVALILALMLVH